MKPCVVAVLILVTGCSSVTEAVIIIEADEDIMERADQLDIRIDGAGPGATPVWEPKAATSLAADFPHRITLAPEGGDASRQYRVSVVASDGLTDIAEDELIGGYVEGESVERRMFLGTPPSDAGMPDADMDTGVSPTDTAMPPVDAVVGDADPPSDTGMLGCAVLPTSAMAEREPVCNAMDVMRANDLGAHLMSDETPGEIGGVPVEGCVALAYGLFTSGELSFRARARNGDCETSVRASSNVQYHVFERRSDGSTVWIAMLNATPDYGADLVTVTAEFQSVVICRGVTSGIRQPVVELDTVRFTPDTCE